MKTYNVGKDEPYDLPEGDDKFVWLVYDYQEESYEGSGEAVALGVDGLIYVKDLSHCSCYGPFDNWATGCDKFTVEDYLRPKESVHELTVKDAVHEKVVELLATAV